MGVHCIPMCVCYVAVVMQHIKYVHNVYIEILLVLVDSS